jgi:hypothetical protein
MVVIMESTVGDATIVGDVVHVGKTITIQIDDEDESLELERGRYISGDVLAYPWQPSRWYNFCFDDEYLRECIRKGHDVNIWDGHVVRVLRVPALHRAVRIIVRALKLAIRRSRAARQIQKAMRPWLDQPKCRDGCMGIRLRVALKNASEAGIVTL